jgi:hypothetical protein
VQVPASSMYDTSEFNQLTYGFQWSRVEGDWLAGSLQQQHPLSSLVINYWWRLSYFPSEERTLRKNINSKVTSFCTGRIFVKISVPMTAPVNYVRRTINANPPPHQKKGGWNHKSTHIKIAIFHTGAWVSLNWVRNEQCEMVPRNLFLDVTREEMPSIQTYDVRIIPYLLFLRGW